MLPSIIVRRLGNSTFSAPTYASSPPLNTRAAQVAACTPYANKLFAYMNAFGCTSLAAQDIGNFQNIYNTSGMAASANVTFSTGNTLLNVSGTYDADTQEALSAVLGTGSIPAPGCVLVVDRAVATAQAAAAAKQQQQLQQGLQAEAQLQQAQQQASQAQVALQQQQTEAGAAAQAAAYAQYMANQKVAAAQQQANTAQQQGQVALVAAGGIGLAALVWFLWL